MNLAIVIPALNEENLILKTLDSFSNQSCKDFIVIVVDNGSIDNTKEIVTDFSKKSNFPLYLVEESKKGVGNARNTGSLMGIEMGSIYIAGTDADTLIPNNWVESIYSGFSKKYDLLCGECDPFFKVKLNYDKAEFVLKARSMFFNKIKPYFRGANFAITSKMFQAAGGFIQPLTEDGKPAPNEDGALEKAALTKGARICGCLATVFPHPRRYISNLQKINEFHGQVHEGGVVTEIRNESDLENSLNDIPTQSLDIFLDKILRSLFNEYVLYVYKDPIFRKKYWKNSLTILKPYSQQEIESYLSNNHDDNHVWEKYKETFLRNIEIWQFKKFS